MVIMILELLAVGFVLGMCITAVVLAAVSATDVLARAKHTNAASAAEIGHFGPRALSVLRPHRAQSVSGHRRAA
jgi:hypothetical protein